MNPSPAPTTPPQALPRTGFWLALAGLTGLYLFLAFFHSADIPLLDPDEPRYAGAGRTMAEGGSWLIPEFNGEPRINKPPLFYWLVAVCVRIAGDSETVVRFPSVAAGLLMLWGTVYVGRRVYGPLIALLGGLVLATCPLFIALSRLCVTDMVLSLFMAGVLGCLWLCAAGKWPARRAVWTAAPLLVLALLTKAVPALAVLLVLVVDRALEVPAERRRTATRWILVLLAGAFVLTSVALYCSEAANKQERAARGAEAALAQGQTIPAEAAQALKHKRTFERVDYFTNRVGLALAFAACALMAWVATRAGVGPLARTRWGWALGAALLGGLWWYGALVHHFGWHEFLKLANFEIGGRLAGSVHREGMQYYVLHLPALAFPWSVGLIAALAAAWPVTGGSRDEYATADRFLLAWTLGVLLFFSIPGGKLATYILALFPAFALLLARLILRLSTSDEPVAPRWRASVAGLNLLATLVIFCLMPVVNRLPAEIRDTAALFPEPPWMVLLIVAIAVNAAWGQALRQRPKVAALLLAAVPLFVVARYFPIARHELAERSQKGVALKVKEAVGARTLVSVGADVESLSYYLGRPLQNVAWAPRPREEVNGREYDAVLLALARRTEPVAAFIDRRYFAHMTRTRTPTVTEAQVRAALPPGARFLYTDGRTIVITN